MMILDSGLLFWATLYMRHISGKWCQSSLWHQLPPPKWPLLCRVGR